MLSRRLGGRWVVVNAGIGGNQVVGPAQYAPDKPFPGGPSAISRLERDVLSLSGVKAVIWLEGTNDFSRTGGVFDGVADFDRATTDPGTGAMKAEFVPDNTVGGPGDKLHPNRLGYQAMGMSIDLGLFDAK